MTARIIRGEWLFWSFALGDWSQVGTCSPRGLQPGSPRPFGHRGCVSAPVAGTYGLVTTKGAE